MKREIKFRMWDNELKEYYPNGFSIDMDGYAWHDDNDNQHQFGSRFILEQFTGFKDRNGTEIYEGDVVKEDFKEDGTHRSLGVMEFYEGSFGSRNKYDRLRIPALFTGKATEGMNLNYYEVIGNIHVNPELLSNCKVTTQV